MDINLLTLLASASRFLKTRYRLPAHEQEEVEQQIAIAIASSLRKGTPIEQHDAYARAIARNVAISYLRRKKHIQSLDELIALDGAPPAASTPTPLAQLVEQENARCLFQAIATLSDDACRTILAVYSEGLTPAEIAALEGCSVKTIYTRLSRAEKFLQSQLKKRFSTLASGIKQQIR